MGTAGEELEELRMGVTERTDIIVRASQVIELKLQKNEL